VKETSDRDISPKGSEHVSLFLVTVGQFQKYNMYKRIWEEELEKADTEHILGHLKLCAFYTMLRSLYFHRQWEDF